MTVVYTQPGVDDKGNPITVTLSAVIPAGQALKFLPQPKATELTITSAPKPYVIVDPVATVR